MADNFDNYGMKVQATASVKMPSVREINKQIDTLEESIKKLRISGQFDDSALKNLTNQLSSLKATVSTANFSSTALSELTNQVEKALGNINISAKVGQELGSAITKGMQQNIDSGVVADIKKISDASTSAVVQNEKKKQEAYKATTETVMYHAGVISKLNKAESNGRFYGSNRDTGYYGTGHYFVDSATKHELDNSSTYSKMPYTSIDISQYDNLFKASTNELASGLHEFLKNLTRFTQGSDRYDISELFSQFQKVFGDTVMDMKEFDAKLEQLKSFMQSSNLSDRSDSVSTQFMKSLGYGGVDTRGTKYADTAYGTVIYDLKEESILQANITDELQKQGQMLEKINYEKGQVFDKTEDTKLQGIIDQQAKAKEIDTEFNKLFDSTKINEYEAELKSVNETLQRNDSIIADCQHGIENADKEARQFAKDMASLGLEVSDEEINRHADDYRVSFQERIDELQKERPLLEARRQQLEENLDAEYKLANTAREQARQIVEERSKEAQQSEQVANTVIQNERKKQQALGETSDGFAKISRETSLVRDNADFKQVFGTASGEAKKAQQHFQELLADEKAVVTVTEKFDDSNMLQSFVVDIQRANGQVETLRYAMEDLSQYTHKENDWHLAYQGGSVDDGKVEKSLTTFAKKADDLQIKLDKMKASYSDLNASRPIKDSGNIFALSQQYDKVAQAIESVRNADNSTFTSMVSNAQKEITTLETMVTQFRNAENVATQMKSVDISSGIAQATERLGKLKANASGFEQMTDTIKNLDIAIANVGDKASLDAFINDLRTAETQLGRVKAEAKQLENVNKIQLSFDDGTYEAKYDSLIAKTRQWINANDESVISTQRLTTAYNEFNQAATAYAKDGSVANRDKLIQKEEELARQIKATTNEVKSYNAEYAKSSKIDFLHQKIQEFYDKNTATHRTWGAQLRNMLDETAHGAQLTATRVNEIEQEFLGVGNAARQAGKLGLSFFDSVKQQASKFVQWVSITDVVMEGVQAVRKMVSNVTELDSSLLELSKVSDLTADGLEKVTDEAYKLGEIVGKTGTQVIDAVTNFKRAGYDLQDSMDFAEQALIMTNVAEGINEAGDAATALISIMKGYGDSSSDFAQKILDATNQVSNTQAINFDDLVDGSQRLSAVANQAGLSYEQMLGALTGGNEILQNIEKTSSGLITIFTRLQSIQLSDEEDVLSVAKLQESFSTATNGVVNIVDQSTGQLRNAYDILSDLNDVWDTLDKNTQEGLAFAAGGTRQKSVFLSIMQNWENVEKATNSAMDSMGSATEENQKYLDSIEGKVSQFNSSVEQLSATIVNSDLIKFFVDLGTTGVKAIDGLVNALTPLGTIGVIGGGILGAKNAGQGKSRPVKQYACPC